MNLKFTIFSITILGLSSCVETFDLSLANNKIKVGLTKKIEQYSIETKAQCQKDIINKATIYADSVIAADNFMELAGTIPFPQKPIKPFFPGAIIIKDTIKATPILK
jgi:hypothetical protein